MWVRKLSLGGASEGLAECYDANPNEGWLMRFQTTDVFVGFIVKDDGSTAALGARPGKAIVTGKWYFVGMGYDDVNEVMWFSVDGSYAHNTLAHAAAGGIEVNSPTSVKWTLGSWAAATNSANADIAHVSWWKDRSLSKDDLIALYNNGAPLPLADYADVAPTIVTPKATFYIHDDNSDWNVPCAYGYTHTNQAKAKAAYCIVNEAGSDTVVRITGVNVSKQGGMTSNVSNRNSAQLQLISAYSGGTDISSASTSAHDTTKTPPANISVFRDVASITTTKTIREIHMIPQWSAFTENAQWGSKARGSKWSGGVNLNLGALIDAGGDKATSPTQPITLRAGEGIALEYVGIKLSHDFNVEITWTDGTDTFFSAFFYSPIELDIPFVFMNEVGSGEVIEIIDITLAEAGDTSEPIYDLMLVEKVYLDEDNPQVYTALLYDTQNDSLPSGVQVYRDVLVDQLGARAGAAQRGDGDAWAWGRTMRTSQTTYRLTDLIQWNNWFKAHDIYRENKSGEGIVVRPGEAVALMRRRLGSGGRKEFHIEFTAVQTPTTFPYPVVGQGTLIKKA